MGDETARDSRLHRVAEHLAVPSGDLASVIVAGLFGGDLEKLDARAELDAAIERPGRGMPMRHDLTGSWPPTPWPEARRTDGEPQRKDGERD